MNEQAKQIPCVPYARTELAVEWMIRDFAHAVGLGFTLLRYFNASGADEDGQYGEDHDHDHETHIIPFVSEVAQGKRDKILIFRNDYPTPNGTCLRDYVHVDDLALAHPRAIEATPPQSAEAFNIGIGHGNSVMDIHRACESVIGIKNPCEVVGRRPGDAPALVADPTKLKTELGWEPRYPDIVRIVDTAWKWHQSWPNGYDE